MCQIWHMVRKLSVYRRTPPSLVLLHLPPEYLPRPFFILCLIGVFRAKLSADAVRQLEAGEEGVQLFLVAQAFLGVEEAQQELLLLAGERIMQRIVGRLCFPLELYRLLRGDVERLSVGL